MFCKCGCGRETNVGRQYISGHNFKVLVRTEAHKRNIAKALEKAWQVKRERMPVGSKNFDPYGYVRVKVSNNPVEWRKEHIIVMEKHLNRQLDDTESIHHINGLRADNRIENLFLCRNKTEHKRIEDTCKSLVLDMMRTGLARFNRREKRYELV